MQRLVLAALVAALFVAAPGASSGHDGRCGVPDPGDTDCDSVRNDGNGPYDNCPTIRNLDQTNTDAGYTQTQPPASDGSGAAMPQGEGDGDACDPDDDADGIGDCQGGTLTCQRAQQVDNCRLVRNPDQRDTTGPNGTPDGRGEDSSANPLCPPVDGDGDGLFDDDDNCPKNPNPGQEDMDVDRRGDVCDSDDDNDTWPDYNDNCPTVSNSEQTDGDGDGVGRACDPDDVRTATSDPTPVPGPGGGSSSAADRVAPRIVVLVPRSRSVADLAGGMPVSVRCSEACGLVATLDLPATAARRLGVPRRIATGTALLGGTGRTYVFFSLRRGVTRRVARAGAGGVGARLRVIATDETGNSRRAERAVRLHR